MAWFAYLWKCGSYAAEVTVPPNTELLGLPGTHPGVPWLTVWPYLETNLCCCFSKASYLELLETLEGHLWLRLSALTDGSKYISLLTHIDTKTRQRHGTHY